MTANIEMILCVVGAVLLARRYGPPLSAWIEWQCARPNRSHYLAEVDGEVRYERDLWHWRAARP